MPLSLARLLQRAFCGLLVTGFYSTPLLALESVPKEQLARAQGWIAKEFQPSTLTAAEQLAEMTWFIHAAAPYRGMQIRVVSEQIPTHEYESKVLARAFADITGIQVVHEITGEDDVVKKLQAQMQTGLPIYDAYVNDSDFIGTHFRKGKTLVLSDYMLSEGREVTLPSLGM